VDSVRCYDKFRIEALQRATTDGFRECALFHGAPCALDLMLCADNRSFLYVDVPNGDSIRSCPRSVRAAW
jgi:hypothetical protein